MMDKEKYDISITKIGEFQILITILMFHDLMMSSQNAYIPSVVLRIKSKCSSEYGGVIY